MGGETAYRQLVNEVVQALTRQWNFSNGNDFREFMFDFTKTAHLDRDEVIHVLYDLQRRKIVHIEKFDDPIDTFGLANFIVGTKKSDLDRFLSEIKEPQDDSGTVTLSIDLIDNRLIIDDGKKKREVRRFQDGQDGLKVFRFIFNGHTSKEVSLAELRGSDVITQSVTSYSVLLNGLKLTEVLAPFTSHLTKNTVVLNREASLSQKEYIRYKAILENPKFRIV